MRESIPFIGPVWPACADWVLVWGWARPSDGERVGSWCQLCRSEPGRCCQGGQRWKQGPPDEARPPAGRSGRAREPYEISLTPWCRGSGGTREEAAARAWCRAAESARSPCHWSGELCDHLVLAGGEAAGGETTVVVPAESCAARQPGRRDSDRVWQRSTLKLADVHSSVPARVIEKGHVEGVRVGPAAVRASVQGEVEPDGAVVRAGGPERNLRAGPRRGPHRSTGPVWFRDGDGRRRRGRRQGQLPPRGGEPG